MKVLFVNYHHLDSNSGIQISNLATQLTKLGVECVVCVPQQYKLGNGENQTFKVVNSLDIVQNKIKFNFDLIHVWTSREITRKITEAIRKVYACPYIVHLEDNEEYLFSAVTHLPFDILKYVPSFLLDIFARPYMIHPRKHQEFLKGAIGITMIVEKLERFCPADVPREVIWAGYQEELHWSSPPDKNLREQLGIAENDKVLIYTGNVHVANQKEVASLYEAVGLLNDRGISTKLVRTGTDYVPLSSQQLALVKQKYCIQLGHVSRNSLPSLLSIADVLVQPGMPGEFNDYRFPSKLPEYLASGKPVILPHTNIGLLLRDQEECVLLYKGDAGEIARKMEFLFSNKELRDEIGLRGKEFAKENLRWSLIAKKLYMFYHSLTPRI